MFNEKGASAAVRLNLVLLGHRRCSTKSGHWVAVAHRKQWLIEENIDPSLKTKCYMLLVGLENTTFLIVQVQQNLKKKCFFFTNLRLQLMSP